MFDIIETVYPEMQRIRTQYNRSLRYNIKPVVPSDRKKADRLTEEQRALAAEAVVPFDLDDLKAKVCLKIMFRLCAIHSHAEQLARFYTANGKRADPDAYLRIPAEVSGFVRF